MFGLVTKNVLLLINRNIKKIYKAESLNLLKKKAFNADFNVPDLRDQKFIKKNDVKPINSQPKIHVKKFPAHNNVIILIAKKTIKETNDVIFWSSFI